MAFNWKTFKTRTLTAAVFVVLMLAGLLFNRWSFFILFSVIHFGCWWEFLKLIEKIYGKSFSKYFNLGLMLIGYGLMVLLCGPGYGVGGWVPQLDLSWPVAIVGFGLFVIGILQSRNSIVYFAGALWGLPYISLSLGLMLNLYGRGVAHFHDSRLVIGSEGYFYPALIIAALWINDTMAYIVGSLIGKTQMSKISPKKTWEGTIGGVIFSVVVVLVLARFVFHFGPLSYALGIIAVIVSVTGTLGDLFESKLKRMANVKDSGHIMPGHGGFLDRFDSLLAAVPFVWLWIFFFMQ